MFFFKYQVIKKVFIFIFDLLIIPFTILSSLLLKLIRKYIVTFWGKKAPFSLLIFQKIGVFPIIDHFYEPYFFTNQQKAKSRAKNSFPGINLNTQEQLELINNFHFNDEILEISKLPDSKFNYSFNKGPFLSGDADILYCMIRYFKPKKIIEIGCGYSSLMIQHGLNKNKQETKIDYNHICIEPYLAEWVSELNVEFVKKKVEDIDISYFKTLKNGDILFIDSSHMIRPGGDVLFEYLEILPILNPGVIVHIHDIFYPNDYPDQWTKNGILFWNEQYLLEAFLTLNKEFKIICATNFLKNNYYNELSTVAPMLKSDREPGSFWIQRI